MRDPPTEHEPSATPSPRSAPAQTPAALRLPPMHALAAFEAAARLGTFAQAAEELCVTQSAISHRIRSLEEHLAAPMFVRVHKQVLLTPQGERFLDGVREAMRHLGTAAASVASGAQARLRITSSPALASQVLIPNLREFLQQHEGLQLEIDTSTRVTDMQEGGYDVALRFGSGPWPGLEQQLLLRETIIALASPAYAASFGSRRTRASLAKATLIHSSFFSWQSWLRSVGSSLSPARSSGVTFHEPGGALDAAVHGLGVVLANQLMTLDLRQRRLLVPFVDASVDMRRHYYAVYRDDSPRSATIRAFLAWLVPCVERATTPSAAR